jgi:integrase
MLFAMLFVARSWLQRTNPGASFTRADYCDHEGGLLSKPNVTKRSFQAIIKSANATEKEEAAKVGRAPVLLPQIRFHDLRHTSATLLLLAGEHAKVISERLGHAGIEITLNTYSHVLPTMQKQAALKMNRLLGGVAVEAAGS